jgi:ATP-dependent Clp protease ATP-binding subunit ClpA
LNYLNERLVEREIELMVTDDVKQIIAERGYDPSMGARPLKRIMDRLLTKPLSKGILSGEIKPGHSYKTVLAGHEINFIETESGKKIEESVEV